MDKSATKPTTAIMPGTPLSLCMSWTKQALVFALVVGMLAVPTVSAQDSLNNPNKSTPTTLYFHIFDTFNKFVINTQAMNVETFEVGGTNFPTLVDTPVNQVMEAQYDFNTLYGTSTAGPVEYDFIENGRPRFHPERGIAADVNLDTSVQPVAYIYIEPRDILGCNTNACDFPPELPNCLPDLTVRVTMRTGDDPGPDGNLDAGDLIMGGQKTYTVCTAAGAPLGSAVALNGEYKEVDSAGIVEFAIPLDVAANKIPKKDAFNVRIDWWQGTAAGGVIQEDQFAEGFLRLAADQDHLPRLEMNIMNPVYIEFIHPQVAAGTLLIHTGVNSPWGTYDINAEDVVVSVEGPSTPVVLNQVVATNEHVHGLHDKAAEITYLWSFRDEGAKDGDYTINLSVKNNAGTATATGSAGFTIKGKEAFGTDETGQIIEPTVTEKSKDTPGVGLLGMVGLLGALAVALRRRE